MTENILKFMNFYPKNVKKICILAGVINISVSPTLEPTVDPTGNK